MHRHAGMLTKRGARARPAAKLWALGVSVVLLAALVGAATTDARHPFYYPKLMYYKFHVSGVQTTEVQLTAECWGEGDQPVQRTATSSEVVRFRTRRAGRVGFKSRPHGGFWAFSNSKKNWQGVRRIKGALARATVERRSTLGRYGTAPDGCDGEPAAQGCGVKSFRGWRLFLHGSGRRVVRLKLGTAGMRRSPFPGCGIAGRFRFPLVVNATNIQYWGDGGLKVRIRPARVSARSVRRGRPRTRVVRGTATARQKIESFNPDGEGVVVTKLRFKVRLVRGARCAASRGC